MALIQSGEGFLTLLKKRDFLHLWLAQLISMTILQASNYALIILIENKTKSTTLIGLAIISFSLPAVLFGAPAGVFVDHMDKRRVLWASNCLRAIATILFTFVLISNQTDLFPLYILTFIISTIGQFFAPAEGATIPLLVSKDELLPALSLFNITFMLSQALGFILLAPLALTLLPILTINSLRIDSTEQLYLIVGLLYLVCALLIAAIPPEKFQPGALEQEAKATEPSSLLTIFGNIGHDMYEGWSFVRHDKQLFLAIIQLSFAGVLILVIGQLATPIVTQLLLRPPNAMPFVFAPAGIGLVVGSVFVPGITHRVGKSRAIFYGTATLTIATLLLPIATLLFQTFDPQNWSNPLLLVIVGLCMLIAGLALNLVNIPAQAAIQERTPDWIKGRVLSLQLALYNACSIPIILFIGAFSDLFGIARVLYIMSTCEIIFGLWGIYYEHRHKRSVTVQEDKEASISKQFVGNASKLID